MSSNKQLAGSSGEVGQSILMKSAKGGYDRILFGGARTPGVVNFGVGAPDDGILQNLKAATLIAAQHRFAQEEAHLLLQYGPTRGDGEFVEALSQFLTTEYKDTVKQDELMLTSGASQGLQMAATHFFNAGDTVFVEDPTYFLALEMLKDLRLNLVPIAQDEEGIQVDLLEKALEERELTGGKSEKFKAMVYTIPTYNNPTSVTLSDARRKKLVDLAYKHKLLVVSDDVYTMLHFTASDSAQRPPPRLCKPLCLLLC
jgi:DNA-binding transcriptional MocR family regulator